MRVLRSLAVVGIVVMSVVLPAEQALSAPSVPDADQAQEKAMAKVVVGRPVKLNTPVGVVRVKVLKVTPVPRRSGERTALTMQVLVQNLSRQGETGLSVQLRCDGVSEPGYNYIGRSGDVYVQYLPPRTQQKGRLTVEWPAPLVGSAQACKNPRLWLLPSMGWSDFTAHANAAGRLSLNARMWGN